MKIERLPKSNLHLFWISLHQGTISHSLFLKFKCCMLSHMNEVDLFIFHCVFLYEIQNCIFHVFSQQMVSKWFSISCLYNMLSEFQNQRKLFSWFWKFYSNFFFLHILVLELLFDKIDIDVMVLFKFDFNHAILNLETIASMKFSFDLNFILLWSRIYVLFKWNVKNSYQKNLKNLVSWVSTDWEFLSIDRMFLLINWTGIENRSSQPEIFWWISSIFQSIDRSDVFSINQIGIENWSSHLETSKWIY